MVKFSREPNWGVCTVDSRRAASLALIFAALLTVASLPSSADEIKNSTMLYREDTQYSNYWEVHSFSEEGEQACMANYYGGHPTQRLFSISALENKGFFGSAIFHEASLRSMDEVFQRVMIEEDFTLTRGTYVLMTEGLAGIKRWDRVEFEISEVSANPEGRIIESLFELSASQVSQILDILTNPNVPSMKLSIEEPGATQPLLEMRTLDLISGDGDAFFFFEKCARAIRPSPAFPEDFMPLDRGDA